MFSNGYINKTSIDRYGLPALDRSGLYIAQKAGGIWVRIEIGVSGRNGVFSKSNVKQKSAIDSFKFPIDRTVLIGCLVDNKLWVDDVVSFMGLSLLTSLFFERWERVLICMDALNDGVKFFGLSEPVKTHFIPLLDSLDGEFDGIELKPRGANLITTRQDKRKNGFFSCMKGKK